MNLGIACNRAVLKLENKVLVSDWTDLAENYPVVFKPCSKNEWINAFFNEWDEAVFKIHKKLGNPFDSWRRLQSYLVCAEINPTEFENKLRKNMWFYNKPHILEDYIPLSICIADIVAMNGNITNSLRTKTKDIGFYVIEKDDYYKYVFSQLSREAISLGAIQKMKEGLDFDSCAQRYLLKLCPVIFLYEQF